MKKQAIELGTSLWVKRGRMALLTLSLTIGLVCLGLLVFGTSGARADPDIAVDGIAGSGEWETDWQVITDVSNEIGKQDACGATGGAFGNPHDNPCYARSGYDLITMWLKIEPMTWYARLDVDGQPGDADSITGTASVLGIGTPGFENGPLANQDGDAMDSTERYNVQFRFSSSGGADTECLLSPEGFTLYAVNTVYQCSDYLQFRYWAGSAFSDTIEYGMPTDDLFYGGACRDQIWVAADVGDSNDGWSEDAFSATWLRLFYVNLTMTSTPTTVGLNEPLTYTIQYNIENSGSLVNPIPATNAYITSTVPTSTTYDSCSGGASCTQSGGIVTWTLSTPITPTATGVVTLVVTVSDTGYISNEAYIHMDEGLCDTDSTQNEPTAVALSSFTADWDGDQVAVAWETVMEIDTAGFNLWRSTSAGGGYAKVNDTLIPSASPGGAMGGSYAFTDADVTPGTTYYYKLEELEVGGARNWYGPASTDEGDPNAVTLAVADTALSWWPVAAGVAAGAGIATLVVMRRRRASP